MSNKQSLYDAKNLIFDVMNLLGSTIPNTQIDDNQLIIDAYEKAYTIKDKETQELFLNLIKELRGSNKCINRISLAWNKSTDKLREVCKTIEQIKSD
jgi:hypothetical protein